MGQAGHGKMIKHLPVRGDKKGAVVARAVITPPERRSSGTRRHSAPSVAGGAREQPADYSARPAATADATNTGDGR
ncbi:hypothetical protein NDU88_001948 [Pleurodeles waltl]|uniref:Uncharacterized protein n=1 Tax=Pleurodeles waltl TaxID=8319 RepID=A0AAV7R9G7_PLEWA|nr:hypothetical protein NDU88_001948 [Pleurodeles waltl]